MAAPWLAMQSRTRGSLALLIDNVHTPTESVALCPIPSPVVVKPAHYDPGSDAEFLGKEKHLFGGGEGS